MYDVVFYVPWIGPLLRPGATPPTTGGAETQIFLLTRALSRSGARVCVVAFEVPERVPNVVDGVAIVGRPPYAGQQPWIGKIREVLTTWDVLRRVPARVVVTRAAGPYVPLVGAFAQVARRRFVYSSASDGDFSSKVIGRYSPLFEWGIRSADVLVVQNRKQVGLSRHFARPTVVIPSIAEPAPMTASPPTAFLWIGRLVDSKQPVEFIELARRLPEAQFWMVGVPMPDGEQSARFVDRMRREAAALPNLIIQSPRPRPALMELVDQAVAVVNTSQEGAEGMPNIFLEGWARGVPALSLSHDPDGLIQQRELGGFASGSRDRLAELAAALWRNRADRKSLSLRCRSYVEANHAPDVVARQWLEVLSIPDRGRC
jgi:glycosyltransferase involved in cell wall biosynthesis